MCHNILIWHPTWGPNWIIWQALLDEIIESFLETFYSKVAQSNEWLELIKVSYPIYVGQSVHEFTFFWIDRMKYNTIVSAEVSYTMLAERLPKEFINIVEEFIADVYDLYNISKSEYEALLDMIKRRESRNKRLSLNIKPNTSKFNKRNLDHFMDRNDNDLQRIASQKFEASWKTNLMNKSRSNDKPKSFKPSQRSNRNRFNRNQLVNFVESIDDDEMYFSTSSDTSDSANESEIELPDISDYNYYLAGSDGEICALEKSTIKKKDFPRIIQEKRKEKVEKKPTLTPTSR